MSNSQVLLQYGDDPMVHMFRDTAGLSAFTITVVGHDPNAIVKLSREAAWTSQHSTIMGPDNSFLYLGAENRPGYVVYGNNATSISMFYFLRPGKKDGSISRYFRAQNGKDYKWKVHSLHRMECMDGRTSLAIWEVTQPDEEAFARLTLRPSSLSLVTEILTSLVLNRIAQAHSW